MRDLQVFAAGRVNNEGAKEGAETGDDHSFTDAPHSKKERNKGGSSQMLTLLYFCRDMCTRQLFEMLTLA